MVLDGLNHGYRGSSDTGRLMINYMWFNPQVIQGWSVNSEFPPGKELEDLNHPTSYRESPHSFNRENEEGKKAGPGAGPCRLLDPTGAMTRPSRLTLCFPSHCWCSFSAGWLSFCQFAFSLHSISHHYHARSFLSGRAYFKALVP